MTWKSTCCWHTNWSGFALHYTGRIWHEYFKWPLFCQGTDLLDQVFFSQSHLIVTQDWPQLWVSSPPSVCERSTGTLPESRLSSTVPPAGFLNSFSLWSTINRSRSHGNPTYSGAWAGPRVPVCLQWTCLRFAGSKNTSQRFPTAFQQCLAGCIRSPVSEWLFCLSASHVPALLTVWRRVRKILALCHGEAWKAKVADKSCPLKMRFPAAWNNMWSCAQNV